MASFLLKVFQRCKCVNFQQSAKTSVLPKWYKERAQVRSGDFMNRFYPTFRDKGFDISKTIAGEFPHARFNGLTIRF